MKFHRLKQYCARNRRNIHVQHISHNTGDSQDQSTQEYCNFVCIRHFFTHIFTPKTGMLHIHKAIDLGYFYIESPGHFEIV